MGGSCSDKLCSTTRQVFCLKRPLWHKWINVGDIACCRYGGSMNTRSNRAGNDRRQFKFFTMFHLITDTCSVRPQDSIFRRTSANALGSLSMKHAVWAPRLRASIPRAPVPAKRSRTTAPWTRLERIEKRDSLRRSEVGRIPVPLNGASFLPFRLPAMMRKVTPKRFV